MKRILSVILIAVTLLVTCPVVASAATNPFRDVKSTDWYYNAVIYCNNAKIMSGVSSNTFSPNGTMTRGMAAQVFYNMEKKPLIGTKAVFTDVKAGKWYTNAINWAKKYEIVSGIGNGKYGPDNTVNRGQMVLMLYNYAKWKGASVSSTASLSGYADKAKVQSWAQTAMKWAVAMDIINGSKRNGKYYLDPTRSITRAEAATILAGFKKKVALPKVDYRIFCNDYYHFYGSGETPAYLFQLLEVNNSTGKAKIEIAYVGRNYSPYYYTDTIYATLDAGGSASFNWTDSWGNRGTGRFSISNGVLPSIFLEMKQTYTAANNRATLATGVMELYPTP